VWGSANPIDTDFLRSLDGHGWHLDRARFDNWLRDAARGRGAEVLAPARIQHVVREGARWQLQIATASGMLAVSTNILIDASGRAATLARRLGARRSSTDRLASWWCHGTCSGKSHGYGLTYIEATESGWWYTAPIPAGRRVLAFHTGPDLLRGIRAHEPGALFSSAMRVEQLSGALAECNFKPTLICGISAAHSSVLTPCCGSSWLACGDAAISFDPLSSQGLLNALFTGREAAAVAQNSLSGSTDAVSNYQRMIREIHAAYLTNLASYYRSEMRWPGAPFWAWRM
jgi:flavin-dependent dehydrogenase